MPFSIMTTTVKLYAFVWLVISQDAGAKRSTLDPPDDPPAFESDFEKVSRSEVFVDKTSFIGDFVDTTDDACVYLTSPRGFGKSTNLDMLRRFLQLDVDGIGEVAPDRTATANYQLFTDAGLNLRVAKQQCWDIDHVRRVSCVDEYFGKFPVIFLKLENVNNKMFERMIPQLARSLQVVFAGYEWLYRLVNSNVSLSGDFQCYFDQPKREFFRRILEGLGNETELAHSFPFLVQLVSRYFNRSVIVIIDDYDCPLINSLRGGKVQQNVYDLADDLIVPLFEQPSAGRRLVSYVRTILLTGISVMVRAIRSMKPLLLETRFYRFLDNSSFASYFGFTEAEVQTVLERNNVNFTYREKVRKFYDGYRIRDTNISLYSSFDVVQYVRFGQLRHYRYNLNITHRCGLFLRIRRIRDKILSMIYNRTAEIDIQTNVSIGRIQDFLKIAKGRYTDELPWNSEYTATTSELFFTNLFENGYLICDTDANGTSACRIPNDKVAFEFKRNVETYYVTRGINFTKSLPFTTLESMVKYDNITYSMKMNLTNQLNCMIEKVNRNAFLAHEFLLDRTEFHYLMRNIAFYNFPRVYFNVPISLLDLRHEFNNRTDYLIDVLVVNNRQKSVLMFNITYEEDLAITLENLVACKPTNRDSKVKIFKYLAINFDAEQLIQVEFGDNQYTDNIPQPKSKSESESESESQ